MKHTDKMVSLSSFCSNKKMSIPAYQRGDDCWSKSKQQLLIDSLLRQWSVPKFYVRKSGARLELLDGQQRVTAIKAFIDGTITVSRDCETVVIDDEKFELAGCSFDDMPDEVKTAFMDTQLSVTYFDSCTNREAEDFFLRLQGGSPLNAAEKRRALGGALPKIVSKITDHPFFDHLSFSARRLAHEDVAAKLLLLTMNQQPIKLSATNLTQMYKENVSIKPDNQIFIQMNEVLDYLTHVMDCLEEPSNQLKKTHVIGLYMAIYEIQQMTGTNLDGTEERLCEWWTKFSGQISDPKIANKQIVSYRLHASKATDTEEAITKRSSIIQKQIESFLGLKLKAVA